MPMVAEAAFKKTTVSEIAVRVAGDASGNIKMRIGTRMKPPPSPTIVPKVPTAAPKIGRKTIYAAVRWYVGMSGFLAD